MQLQKRLYTIEKNKTARSIVFSIKERNPIYRAVREIYTCRVSLSRSKVTTTIYIIFYN